MRDEDFERIYSEHAEALFGFLVYRTGNRALAEDVLADTFERVLRSRARFDPRKASEKTWVYSIALNRLKDLHRKSAAEGRAIEKAGPDAAAFDPGAALAGVEDREELGRALAGLSAEEREAVSLRFGADLTVPEIAKLLGEKLSTVEGRVYRALRKLRSALEEPGAARAARGGR
jgi:RNA polymerase sigma factor (sigma-70 family)